MSAWVFTYRHFRAPRVGLLISKMTASCPKKGVQRGILWIFGTNQGIHAIPTKGPKVCSFEIIAILRHFEHAHPRSRKSHSANLAYSKVTKSSSCWGPGFADVCLKTSKKRTNLSASSNHDLFNILKCPFEGHHKTSNGSIKEGHFEEAEESSRSHPIWPTLPSRGE